MCSRLHIKCEVNTHGHKFRDFAVTLHYTCGHKFETTVKEGEPYMCSRLHINCEVDTYGHKFKDSVGTLHYTGRFTRTAGLV